MKLLVALGLVVAMAQPARADEIAGLPDPTARILRWPLSVAEHPELAPRYAVAKDLAESADWMALCSMGAHKRSTPNQRDQTRYLGAWCAIANHDLDTGVETLQSLLSSRVRGLPAAVRADIANILANEGTADRARALLATHRITDLVVRDRLAALFADMNRLDDAEEMNDLALSATDGVQNACMRQARRIVLHPERYRGTAIDKHPRLFQGSCKDLELELTCWLDVARCGPHFRATGRPHLGLLFDAIATQKRKAPNWLDQVSAAVDALPQADLVLAASFFEVAVSDTPCESNARADARALLHLLMYKVPEKQAERLREAKMELHGPCDP